MSSLPTALIDRILRVLLCALSLGDDPAPPPSLQADFPATNGVIHSINAVLIPK